jgi:hypothetical protein
MALHEKIVFYQTLAIIWAETSSKQGCRHGVASALPKGNTTAILWLACLAHNAALVLGICSSSIMHGMLGLYCSALEF